jgi:hypothetical protein
MRLFLLHVPEPENSGSDLELAKALRDALEALGAVSLGELGLGIKQVREGKPFLIGQFEDDNLKELAHSTQELADKYGVVMQAVGDEESDPEPTALDESDEMWDSSAQIAVLLMGASQGQALVALGYTNRLAEIVPNANEDFELAADLIRQAFKMKGT